eukprot:CAMPEP_0176443712 /NCGR_PEP_ID=MMETSP0127-20121128/22603_1 /TAXON_ID=938130 /ORGANISM="Platyophrya macrostoma, Strain WH" /LENGTH=456 /DNA_ID=CAMNT_0017829027 /DNA_START=350 /DNA_END=1720 /DNA_ORIENTATION=-
MAPNHSESRKQKAHSKNNPLINKTKKSGLARRHENSQKPAEDDTWSIIKNYCCDSEGGEFYHESRCNHKNEELATHTKKSRKKLHVSRQDEIHNDELCQHQAQTPSSNYHCEDHHQKGGCNHQENEYDPTDNLRTPTTNINKNSVIMSEPEEIIGDIDGNYVGMRTRLPYLVSTGVMHFKLDRKTEQWLSSIITLLVQDNMRAYERKVQSELEGMFTSYKEDRHHSFLVLDRFADGFADFKRKIDEMSKKINHLENELQQQQYQYNQKPSFNNNQEKLSSSYFGGGCNYSSSKNTFQESQQQLHSSIMQFNSPVVVAQQQFPNLSCAHNKLQQQNATPHRLIDSISPSYSFPLQTSNLSSSALNFSLQQQPILFDDDNDIHNNKRPSDNKMDIEKEKEIDIAEEEYSNNKQKADRGSYDDQKEEKKTIISCFQKQPNQVISKSFQIPSSKIKRNTN